MCTVLSFTSQNNTDGSQQFSYSDKFSTTPKLSFFQMCKGNRRKEDCESKKTVLMLQHQKDYLVVKKHRKKPSNLLRVYKCSIIPE